MTKRKKTVFVIIIIIVIGLMIPQKFSMPVDKASSDSYNKNSFWYYPWGKSGTHKGVDIFAKSGTRVCSSTNGIIIYRGEINRGGNVVLVLGPKWRVHYYAHLQKIETSVLSIVNRGELIGTVGTTGNALGKPPHLHYSIITLLPYFWQIDNSIQGWKKMFYLNPIEYLKQLKDHSD